MLVESRGDKTRFRFKIVLSRNKIDRCVLTKIGFPNVKNIWFQNPFGSNERQDRRVFVNVLNATRPSCRIHASFVSYVSRVMPYYEFENVQTVTDAKSFNIYNIIGGATAFAVPQNGSTDYWVKDFLIFCLFRVATYSAKSSYRYEKKNVIFNDKRNNRVHGHAFIPITKCACKGNTYHERIFYSHSVLIAFNTPVVVFIKCIYCAFFMTSYHVNIMCLSLSLYIFLLL